MSSWRAQVETTGGTVELTVTMPGSARRIPGRLLVLAIKELQGAAEKEIVSSPGVRRRSSGRPGQ